MFARRRTTAALVGCLAITLLPSLASAAPSAPPSASAAVQVEQGGRFVYAIEEPIFGWNLSNLFANTFDAGQVLEQIYPSVFNMSPDLTHLLLNTDLMRSARLVDRHPQTVVYRIRAGADWSDGTPIDVRDFRYAWKTQNGRGCPTCAVASTTGFQDIKSIQGSHRGKKVTAVFGEHFADWKSLFGAGYGLLPAHIAAKHGSLAHSFNDYFTNKPPAVSGGPFAYDSGTGDRSVTLVRNAHYYGAPAKLDTLKFKVIGSVDDEVRALRQHVVDAIYPSQLSLSSAAVDKIRSTAHVNTTMARGALWEHLDFNLMSGPLKNPALRRALFVAFDRKQAIAASVGTYAPNTRPLNNRMLMAQQAGYRDNVSEFHLGSGDIDRAKAILTDAGYTGVGTDLVAPSGHEVRDLRFRYTVGNTLRQKEGQKFASAAAQLGVTVTVQSTDDLGRTLTHGDGAYDYDIVVFAWVGGPFFGSNRDIYRTGGGSNFGGYSNAKVDSLLRSAAGALDRSHAVDLYNRADRLISKDAYTLPVFQRPDLLAVYRKWGNVRENASGQGPAWNAQRWGVRV
jgi:peptide/nickel transport system substrate-binding protein